MHLQPASCTRLHAQLLPGHLAVCRGSLAGVALQAPELACELLCQEVRGGGKEGVLSGKSTEHILLTLVATCSQAAVFLCALCPALQVPGAAQGPWGQAATPPPGRRWKLIPVGSPHRAVWQGGRPKSCQLPSWSQIVRSTRQTLEYGIYKRSLRLTQKKNITSVLRH